MHFLNEFIIILQKLLLLRDVSKTRNGLENGLVNGLEGTPLEMIFAIENLLNRRQKEQNQPYTNT